MADPKIEELATSAKEYVAIQYDLLKLQLTEKMSGILSKMMSDVLVVSISVIALLFLSVGSAFYLSMVFKSYAIGFGFVGILYTLIALFFFAIRKSILRLRIRDRLILELSKEDKI
ncbi:hypothetical protein [Aurantibacillus circumpalustris]|uniref:hypothetical protein n=1 Tax=Aurantibacillus circumpalustris TaxID=3036359 RepID=UPI00295BA92C|nr:hypothetical protein [Aurantibacillus circumpalustris]